MTAQAPAESLSVSLGLIIHNNWDWYYAWDQIQQVPCTGVPPVQGFEQGPWAVFRSTLMLSEAKETLNESCAMVCYGL